MSPSSGVVRRRIAAGVAVATVSLSGCSNAPPAITGPAGDQTFGHVHGMGIDPADNALYVASHMGVFKQTPDGFERIADRWQDTMAFTVVGPHHFLASGHPDMREDKPVHLGLIESTDAAETWESLSLEGLADFHALEPAGERLYGYDSQTQTLMVTSDRREWQDLIRLPVVDLAADPNDAESLMITDPSGRLMRMQAGLRLQEHRRWRLLAGASTHRGTTRSFGRDHRSLVCRRGTGHLRFRGRRKHLVVRGRDAMTGPPRRTTS